jgi:lipoprotein-anchoring transpeptidase ErfK/SrfK
MYAETLSRICLLGSLLGLQTVGLGCTTDHERGKKEKLADKSAEETPSPQVARQPEKRDSGPEEPPKRIFAKKFVVPVRQASNRHSERIGYLRAGSVLMAKTARPVGNETCRGGWYELETGGFVCNRRDVIAFQGEKLPERRATQPDLEARLPYPYGRIIRDRTAVYRRLPTAEEMALLKARRRKGGEQKIDEGVASSTERKGSDEQQSLNSVERAASSRTAGGDRKRASEEKAGPGKTAARAAGESEAAAAGDETERAERADAGPPTLADLAGDEDGLIERWLMKGFHVALDRELEKDGRRYWQTQANGFIAYDNVRTVSGTTFQGISLEEGECAKSDGGIALNSEKQGAGKDHSSARAKPTASPGPEACEWSLPVGYVLSSKTWCYTLDERGRLRRAEKPGYHYPFRIAGEREIRGKNYYLTEDERYFRASKVARIDARDPPRKVGEDEKWIDVDLSSQSLVAYVGARPVYATVISSGRVENRRDPLKNFETPTGSFRIERKHLTHTMDGDTAVDGPYSVEDVPYVMYFQLAYALHSAFWHNAFGRPRSHGCINMAPLDAKWLFNWISPELPRGWHVSYPTGGQKGTRIYIRGETPEW